MLTRRVRGLACEQVMCCAADDDGAGGCNARAVAAAELCAGPGAVPSDGRRGAGPAANAANSVVPNHGALQQASCNWEKLVGADM